MFAGKILKFAILFTLYSCVTCSAAVNICVVDNADASIKLADLIKLSAKKNAIGKDKTSNDYNVVRLKSSTDLKKRDDCTFFIGTESSGTVTYTSKNLLYVEKLLIVKYDDGAAFDISSLKNANILYNSEEVFERLDLSNIQYNTGSEVDAYSALEKVCKKNGEVALIMLNMPFRELQKSFRTCALSVIENDSNDHRLLNGGTLVNNPFDKKVLSYSIYMFAKDKKLADYVMTLIKANSSVGEYMKNVYSIELNDEIF
ncbi:hypothetical protein Fsol_00444 [Candidatus Fokinia solitaria]|uniref:Uncharacterized protein n=1 Tax=Candidatus Fokinia solitaria TaxID=1802984 RepID=A0A2U8BSB8_9RICK|nr:hypothetical protein [Candidatus Fokinia solitaria]AWD33239.1 hypothetical protein Fsol_00444 [Candidatus Fokinia solitaria]